VLPGIAVEARVVKVRIGAFKIPERFLREVMLYSEQLGTLESIGHPAVNAFPTELSSEIRLEILVVCECWRRFASPVPDLRVEEGIPPSVSQGCDEPGYQPALRRPRAQGLPLLPVTEVQLP
jgi:hypothetical protein